jgi:VWFA-related protein
VDVRLVNVEVTVTDSQGSFMDNLKRENFLLREDGVRQEIAHFASTRAPVRVVLLVEMSPAVYLIHRDHLVTVYELLRALRPDDEVALVSYARSARREVDFTRNKSRIEKRLVPLGSFGLGMADMNLLDAVAETLDWLSPPPRRTAVVVIGTGLDSGSSTAWAPAR